MTFTDLVKVAAVLTIAWATFATVDNEVLRKQRDDARASYARCRGDSE